jgi:hypothetical protein
LLPINLQQNLCHCGIFQQHICLICSKCATKGTSNLNSDETLKTSQRQTFKWQLLFRKTDTFQILTNDEQLQMLMLGSSTQKWWTQNHQQEVTWPTWVQLMTDIECNMQPGPKTTENYVTNAQSCQDLCGHIGTVSKTPLREFRGRQCRGYILINKESKVRSICCFKKLFCVFRKWAKTGWNI